LVDPAPSFCSIVSEQAPEELKVLLDGQGRVKILAQPLRHVGDVWTDCRAMARAGHVAAQHFYFAFLDRACACNQRHQARLTYAIGAYQADHLPRWYLQVDTVERNGLPVTQSNIR
jgi:hypothetical protein